MEKNVAQLVIGERTFVFSELLTWNDLIRNHSKKKFGIYVWGFMYDNQFVPYYVGKKEGLIVERLEEHRQKALAIFSTYKRPTKEFFPNFVFNSDFPDNCKVKGLEDKYISDFKEDPSALKDKWYYLNRKSFIDYFKQIDGDNFSINDIHSVVERSKEDVFSLWINEDSAKDMFRAFYFEIDDKETLKAELNLDKDSRLLNLLESVTKYSLKGKTVSESNSLNSTKNLIKALPLNCKIENLDYNFFESIDVSQLQEFNKRINILNNKYPY
jgi:hypothetical protein